MSKEALIWKKSPERGDYAAAGAFLSLILPSPRARGDIAKGVPLIVADGYHRIGAVYYYDEHAPVAVRTASLD